MEWEADDGKETAAAVVGLIERATSSTKPKLGPRILKAIKSVVRHFDLELRLAVENLMSLMKRDHSQIRPVILEPNIRAQATGITWLYLFILFIHLFSDYQKR